MTFKHTKFGDSATMRSLERVAQAKGWLQDDPHLVKNAASKAPNLTPSESLMENIIKLCNGLRTAGFEKHAEQIESSFVAFKLADKTYDISGEEGKDLIHAAHPEGGHQMEDVEGDAYIEDILEKHLKMVDVAEGEPKAKTAKSVLDAVKVALGAPPLGFQEVNLPSAPSSYGRLMNFLGKSPKLELAGEGTEAAEEAGAAAGGGEAAAGGAGAMAAGGAAILAGAIAGGMIGNALFEHYYQVTDLKEAGDRVLSELKDVESDLNPRAYTYMTDFAGTLSQIATLYPVIAETQKEPTAENVASLNKLNDLIYKSRKLAGSIWSFAQSKKDDQFLGALRGFGDVVAASQNYMNVSQKINAVIDQFFAQAAQFAQQHSQQKSQQKTTQVGGSGSDALLQDYSSVMNTIDRYSAAVEAKRQPNANKVINYLNQIKQYVASEQAKFSKVSPANRDVAVSPYQDRLGKAKALLDALKSKQGLQ